MKRFYIIMILLLAVALCAILPGCGRKSSERYTGVSDTAAKSTDVLTTAPRSTVMTTSAQPTTSAMPGTNIPDSTYDGAIERAGDRLMDGAKDAESRLESGVDGMQSRVNEAR